MYSKGAAMTTNPYDVLGLSKTATTDEIKKAYRKLVRTSHPDLNPDDAKAEERFKAVSQAYEILKNPETRARYDAGEIDGLGAEQRQRQYYRDFADAPDHTYQQPFSSRPDIDPSDFFAEILRNRARDAGGHGFGGATTFANGADARYRLEVPFLDAARGTETRITLPDGQNLAVKIPRGTEDGQTLRLRGKGAPGFGGGPAGDALVTIIVPDHPVFKRDGDDITLTLPVTFDEAILGAKITVPTIDGPVGLTIPPKSQAGKVLRLRGRGITRTGQKVKGDQKVILEIVVPKTPDASLVDFLTEWRKTHAVDPRSDILKGAQK